MASSEQKRAIDGDFKIRNHDSDEDVPDEVHNRLLENIKQIHGQPKITPAIRNEPAAEVSEFSFHSKKKSTSGKTVFREDDLIRAIKKKQPKVAQKLETAKKAKTLLKPLETIHEKKIQREVGFENLKTRLNRWNDVIQNNRVSDQLSFPLKSRKIEVYDHTDCDLFSVSGKPTSLEIEMNQVLKASETAKEDQEKIEQSKFRLTLKEIIEKRKMMAKVKAQASYKMAKAARQNKIKSKKYHRIQRREKTKQQMKDFETLQKTDPEAALKQLETLEKTRAEERATLRHRNTGKWARNQMVKAKYNKESRIALSDQLSRNRELTQKRRDVDSDSESVDSETEAASRNVGADPNNPWIADTNEYTQFVANYKKFWDEKLSEETGASGSVEVQGASGSVEVQGASDSVEVQSAYDSVEVQDDADDVHIISSNETKDEVVESSIINSSGKWKVTEVSPRIPAKRKLKEVQNEVTTKKAPTIEKKKKTKRNKVPKQAAPENAVSVTAPEIVKSKAEHQKPTSSAVEVTIHQSGSQSNDNIDPNKYLKVASKNLATEIPDVLNAGDEGLDDEEEDGKLQYRMTIGEAFAEDDVVAEFQEEKKKAEAESQPTVVDLSLPGWGDWTDSAKINSTKATGLPKPQRPRMNKRMLFRVPKAPPRKDANKGHVIINEEKSDKMKEHLVSEVPYPFTKVKDYEASIRAPIGRTWLPETAHQQLIAPPVVTKLGTVIEPMDEGELITREDI